MDALVSATSAKEAIQKGLAALRTARNLQTPLLPPASPLTERSPRTGNAAIAREQGESLDEATRTKQQFNRPSNSLTLAQRFSNQKAASMVRQAQGRFISVSMTASAAAPLKKEWNQNHHPSPPKRAAGAALLPPGVA